MSLQASFMGDVGFYGASGINFYTENKGSLSFSACSKPGLTLLTRL
jgi:hypothetical protein